MVQQMGWTPASWDGDDTGPMQVAWGALNDAQRWVMSRFGCDRTDFVQKPEPEPEPEV